MMTRIAVVLFVTLLAACASLQAEALLPHFEAVEAARQEVALTYFEFTTLAIMRALSRATLDLVILEVGLGGRLDAVNAIDTALRAALTTAYPHLDRVHLTDYKVRILDGATATGAVTRVLIDFSNGERTWTTIGVSTNIIEASWDALVDSLEYAFQPRGNDPRSEVEASVERT